MSKVTQQPAGETQVVKNDDLPPDQKIMLARARLIQTEPFYGHLTMMIDWVANEMRDAPPTQRTMYVRVKPDRRIELGWNPEFVRSQSLHELIGVIEHELEHIVHLHMVRCDKTRDPFVWNIAADMTVNGTREHPLIGYIEYNSQRTMPIGGNLVYRPPGKEWESLTTERLYDKLMKNAKTIKVSVCGKCGGTGKDQGNGGGDGKPEDGANEGNGGGGKPEDGANEGNGGGDDAGKACPDCKGYGGQFDYHGKWDSAVSAEEARQIVQEMVRDATEKSRGRVPGHLVEAIDRLQKPIVPWYHLLRDYLGRNNRGRRWTWSRANRRRDAFGIKGASRHAVGQAVVVIDTSGSISTQELQTFWAEIESMLTRVSVSVLQWDHAFQGWWPKYRKGDWKKIKIAGRGGTDMAAPLDYLMKEGLIPRNGPVIMLTDGACNWHEPCDFPYITVITQGQTGPGWGHEVFLRDKAE